MQKGGRPHPAAPNDLWTISYDEAVSSAKTDWTEKTAHMTDADFKDALSQFANHVEEHSARCLLVDVQRFKPVLSEEIGQWRDSAIIPRYNAVGIQKDVVYHRTECAAFSCSEYWRRSRPATDF